MSGSMISQPLEVSKSSSSADEVSQDVAPGLFFCLRRLDRGIAVGHRKESLQ